MEKGTNIFMVSVSGCDAKNWTRNPKVKENAHKEEGHFLASLNPNHSKLWTVFQVHFNIILSFTFQYPIMACTYEISQVSCI